MLKRYFLIVSIFIFIFMVGCSNKDVKEVSNNINNWELYSNETYKVSLEYPSDWKVKKGYEDRYEGESGFFQIGAISGNEQSIDYVAENDAYHKLSPYGENPQIITTTISGQEARLILPSDDQSTEWLNQAGLIVKYPKDINIDGDFYSYFILWADTGHINKISKTIKFLNN